MSCTQGTPVGKGGGTVHLIVIEGADRSIGRVDVAELTEPEPLGVAGFRIAHQPAFEVSGFFFFFFITLEPRFG